jgi:hypothetical protein
MRGLTYLALAVALPAAAGAQQIRAGAEFQVNTYTTNVQRRPDVRVHANGEFIVTWLGYGAQDASSYGVFAQRYDVAGAPLGGEFRVNTYTTSYQFRPLVASDRRGNFVVVWSSYTQDGSAYGVFGQRFDALGNPRGGEFQVNSYTTGGQGSSYNFVEQNSAVAMAPGGSFVVVWGSYYDNQDGSKGSVHGQRYDANGARLGAEFQVNTYTTDYQFGPSVAVRGDNSFVVTWTTDSASGYAIRGQRYDASGARAGGEFQVSAYTVYPQQSSTVRMRDDGEFTVAWTEASNLVARRFDASGNPVGAQFQVNTSTGAPRYTYAFGMDGRGNFVVNWNNHGDGSLIGIGGRRFLGDGTPREAEYVVNAYTTGLQFEAAVASDDVGNVVSVWLDNARDGNASGVFAQRFGGLRPTALDVNATGNRVWEPGETVAVAPTWRNVNGAAQTFAAALSNLTGPAGATYTLTDGTGDYGTVANNTSAPCTDCYQVQVDNPSPRPVQHWDASAVESITPDTQGQQKVWRLHIGGSFTDVPSTNPFYRFVETLLHHGVTGGCGGTSYCPSVATTRDQMSVFVLVAKEGAGFTPPACGTPVFTDVPASNPFCRFIEELSRRGVVSGCGGNNYCPTSPVTREQMAIFVLRTLDPALNPPACVAPNMFADVPDTSPFCRWIEELATRGVVTGCGGNNYCPTASVTREQMGVFISSTFGLTLYGP